jgi:hypothetical protein
MKITILAVALAAAIGANADTFTGVITDTMCGHNHEMMKDHLPNQCVKMCTKGRASYALYDGTMVMKLSDQKTPAKFAARKVTVTGTLDHKNKMIKVSSIELADGN